MSSENVSSEKILLEFGSARFRRISILVLTFSIVGAALITQVVLNYNKRHVLEITKNSIETVLNTTVEGLDIWISEKKKLVSEFGES
jgi:hypothetical protein